jgi:hypothetical protein
MSIKIFVWLPRDGNVGHSSMLLGEGTYISLWPGHGRKGFKRSAIRSVTLNVKRKPHYRDFSADVEAEGFEPTTVECDGLDEPKIRVYWEKVQASELQYELTEFNCSTIIANALYIGSGIQPTFQPFADIDSYLGIGIPLGGVEAWEPKHILEYAKHIKKTRR